MKKKENINKIQKGYTFLVAGWWQKERQRGNKTACHTQLTVVRETKLYIDVAGVIHPKAGKIHQISKLCKASDDGRDKTACPPGTWYITTQALTSSRWGNMQGPSWDTEQPRAPRSNQALLCSSPALLGMKVPPTSSSCSHFLPCTEGFTSPLLLSSQVAIWSRQFLLPSVITVFPCLITSFPNLGCACEQAPHSRGDAPSSAWGSVFSHSGTI